MNSVERVKSICRERKIPISKLEKDLGYANGYIGQLRKGVFPDDRLVEIATYFGVSVDYLLGSEQNEAPILTKKDERDIEKRMEAMLEELESAQGDLMFSGQALDPETKELLAASLRNSMQMGKLMAKQKFTPKRYKK